ncbi:MAG: hypothetical protein AVDCRST_MAG34-2333 [uncultured Nocardioidaceae bacterium]|uniref:Tyr recombinase domain-containing protein n=1 Tax=uncultured Nocardioidaceae bacterium TaxID=253824 RepID=A0A6J4MH89_9ACTN|nr:MAG: hypothetical protein AVDCRST_MAG34-2333 [uncultured Nocardioidaceae bacterium]
MIRFLKIAQTITVHHGALAYLLGIDALRASEAAAVRIEDYQETLRGHRVLHSVGKGRKPATMPIIVPVLRVRRRAAASGLPARWCSARPQHISPHSLRHAAITNALDAGMPLRDAQILARHAGPRTSEHHRARGNLDALR